METEIWKINGCTEQEWRLIENFIEHGNSYDLLTHNRLNERGSCFLAGLRATPGASAAAQSVLAVLAIKVPLKIETQEADNTPWVPYRTLVEAVNSYRRSLRPPVDIEALESDYQRHAIAFAEAYRAEPRDSKRDIVFENDFRRAARALDEARAPKSTELELAREALTRLRAFASADTTKTCNAEWRAFVEALEEWEKLHG